MQYTYATSAYHEVRFLVHFHLAIRANFERGDLLLHPKHLIGERTQLLGNNQRRVSIVTES